MEKVKIDGIPIEDYGRPTGKTVYPDSYNIMHTNFMQVGAMQGWQCPICKRVLAPFVQECPCKGQGMATMTVATTELKGADNIE